MPKRTIKYWRMSRQRKCTGGAFIKPEISQSSPVPKWLQYRYSILWKAHGQVEFTQEEAEHDLGLPRTTVRVVLSELRKAGWIKVSIGEHDIRKFTYQLKTPEEICQGMNMETEIANLKAELKALQNREAGK